LAAPSDGKGEMMGCVKVGSPSPADWDSAVAVSPVNFE